MKKNKIYDLLIIILVYIGISCIPFSLIPISANFVVLFQIIGQILLFFIILLILKKSDLEHVFKKSDYKVILWFLPLIIVCFSNFFCLFDKESSITYSFSLKMFLDICLSIFIAWNEEYIFRLLLINNFDKQKSPLFKIFVSSSIFALCHLTHFLSSFNPIALIDVLYTFGLGIIFGFIFVYSNSIIAVFVFHSLFNIINNNLASTWIHYGSSNAFYYLTNILVGLIAGMYLLALYLFKLRKSNLNKQ